MSSPFYPTLHRTIQRLDESVDAISPERKMRLAPLSDFIQARLDQNSSVQLSFICTHNSRRSHLGQIWAATAAAHCGVPGVTTFSGGTEATAFNPRAIAAIERDGFLVKNPGGTNPHYEVSWGPDAPPMTCFSKIFDDPANPSEDFAAVMTCTDADQNCPVIIGATRISLPYDDPKAADDTPEEAIRYSERSAQVGAEMLFVFRSVVAKNSP